MKFLKWEAKCLANSTQSSWFVYPVFGSVNRFVIFCCLSLSGTCAEFTFDVHPSLWPFLQLLQWHNREICQYEAVNKSYVKSFFKKRGVTQHGTKVVKQHVPYIMFTSYQVLKVEVSSVKCFFFDWCLGHTMWGSLGLCYCLFPCTIQCLRWDPHKAPLPHQAGLSTSQVFNTSIHAQSSFHFVIQLCPTRANPNKIGFHTWDKVCQWKILEDKPYFPNMSVPVLCSLDSVCIRELKCVHWAFSCLFASGGVVEFDVTHYVCVRPFSTQTGFLFSSTFKQQLFFWQDVVKDPGFKGLPPWEHKSVTQKRTFWTFIVVLFRY